MTMRILVIEDEARTADFIERGLKEKGHAVDVCRTGPEGLSFALGGDHDAIILDRMLPQMDGLTILKRLREEDRQTPAIILSALGQIDHRVEGLKAGSDDYLVKPFAFSELLARLEAIVRRRDPRAAEQTELKVDDLRLDLQARRAFRGAREIDLLTRLQECCNVVQLLTVFEDEEHAYLVCELCRGGDLEKLLMVGAQAHACTSNRLQQAEQRSMD